MLRVVTDEPAGEELAVMLDEICREGGRRMLATALEAEVYAYLAAHAEERDEGGRRLVVCEAGVLVESGPRPGSGGGRPLA